MERKHGTNIYGRQFTDEEKRLVWNKASKVNGKDENLFRIDTCGALIEWSQHGVVDENGTGWEIDHIIPVSKGGDSSIWNLQPLHWKNNRSKSDDMSGKDYCVVLGGGM